MKWIMLLLLLVVVAGCSSSSTNDNLNNVPTAPTLIDNAPTGSQDVVVEQTPSGVTSVELANHNKESDCWVGFEGQVFDITDWLPIHPGSAAAIIPYCGTSDRFENAFSMQHGTSQINRLFKEGILKGDLI